MLLSSASILLKLLLIIIKVQESVEFIQNLCNQSEERHFCGFLSARWFITVLFHNRGKNRENFKEQWLKSPFWRIFFFFFFLLENSEESHMSNQSWSSDQSEEQLLWRSLGLRVFTLQLQYNDSQVNVGVGVLIRLEHSYTVMSRVYKTKTKTRPRPDQDQTRPDHV